jgi:O-6-methylguanine DNA methyltransferase
MTNFFSKNISTPLGSMVAISDDTALYILEFLDNKSLGRKIKQLSFTEGIAAPLTLIESEIKAYFDGQLNKFKTPIQMHGSPFQKLVWNELLNIPYGETRSYLEEANAIGKPTSYRAVANANGANKLAIIIPCHRIINNNGEIGGYGGGIARKKWLLEHETRYK